MTITKAKSVLKSVKTKPVDKISITEFDKKVYDKCKSIPLGKVVTYATIAMAIGNPKAMRAVGNSLRKNPFAPEVPCHRVIASDLSLGGFYGSKDSNGELLKKKLNMLSKEGVLFNQPSIKVIDNTNNVKVDKTSVLLQL
eukprot:gene18372-24070_t